jgi:thiamine biosynthesis lipoprotein
VADLLLREGRAMGSPLRLQAMASSARLESAWADVRDEFEATERALSRFRASSEVEVARRAGGQVAAPSRRLSSALAIADRARRVTNGRFDPRVLVDLERLGSRPLGTGTAQALPVRAGTAAHDRSTRLLQRVGRGGPIEIPVPVDFGGIGKGLALRWAARRAAAILGERPFLLEAGGDLVGQGRPDRLGWRIGIEDPSGHEAPLAVLGGGDGPFAVATSSVRLARWRAPGGREVHHLIDPATGEPGGPGLLAVTVAAADPAWAEVWSKSLFLEGTDGIADVARRRGLAAWWVSGSGDLEMTPAARALTTWVAAEAA